jgi:hypothetical protein
MDEPSHTWPKCQQHMGRGFVLNWAYGMVFQAHWVRGLPSPASFWRNPALSPPQGSGDQRRLR